MSPKRANQNSNGKTGNQHRPAAKPGKPLDEYGREGTNKTVPEPKADNEPSEELGNTRHIGKTPYTRG